MKTEIRALILCGTLKASSKFSHTRTMCDFFVNCLKQEGAEAEIVNLTEFNIKPGTETDEGEGDEWQSVLKKILAADIIIFATPIWWGTHSSIIQRVIERMDALNDELLETGKSELANKIGGMIISGAEDGAENIIGQIANFFVWNGITLPPACSFSYLGEYAKNKEALLQQFKKSKSLTNMARVMAHNLIYFAKLLKAYPLPEVSEGTLGDIPPGTLGMTG